MSRKFRVSSTASIVALASFSALTVVACSGASTSSDDDEARAGVDDAELASEAYYVVERAVSTCASSSCGGFTIARVGGAKTTCADHVARVKCPVSNVTTPSLSAATHARAIAATAGTGKGGASDGHVGLVVRASLQGKTAVASKAWAAPTGAGTPNGGLYLVTKNACRTTCAPSTTLDLASNRSRVVSGVDFGASPGSDAELAEADAAGRTSEGLLAFGTITGGSGSGTTAANAGLLEAGQYLLPLLPSGGKNLCTDELTVSLADAAAGLSWMSETDRAFDLFARDGEGAKPITPARLLALEGLPADTVVETRTVDAFFAPRTAACDPAVFGEEYCADVPRYRALVKTIGANLRNATVIRVGTIDIRVYIVGQTACGDLAGLTTSVVET